MTEEKAVAVYDPEKLMDSIKARIKGEFVSMIPDDAWKAMVKKAIDSFFERKKGQWDSNSQPSEFETLVREQIYAKARAVIADTLNGPEWNIHWEEGKNVIGTALEKLIQQNVGAIVTSIMGEAIQNVIQQMRSNIAR